MNTIAAQLRSKKDRPEAGGLDAFHRRAGRRDLMRSIGGSLDEETSSYSLRTMYVAWVSRLFISRPVAVSVAGIVLVASGLMTTVSAAEESLPGDVLYTVKLMNERAQIQLASLDRKAVLHTEFAERRLREVEELQADTVTRNSSLVTQTMQAYSQEVASANQSLRDLQATGDAATTATANAVDQKLAALDSTIAHPQTPVTSEDGSEAVSQAAETTQVAQDDVVNVVVEVHDKKAQTLDGSSEQDLQDMFIRQFGALAARKEFDLRRISVIEDSLAQHADALSDLDGVSPRELSALKYNVATAVEDVGTAMDLFAASGYRSAFDILKTADNDLREIESTLAAIETQITSAIMAAAQAGESSEDASGIDGGQGGG